MDAAGKKFDVDRVNLGEMTRLTRKILEIDGPAKRKSFFRRFDQDISQPQVPCWLHD